jgi:hypothetical protein
MLRGLSIRSIAVIFAPVTVNPTRVTGFPSAAVTMPMAPLIRAGKPVGRAPDMAGPQVSNWTDLIRGYLTASHRRRRVVLPVRIPGTRAVRDGVLLPPPAHTVGARTWDQFLAAHA